MTFQGKPCWYELGTRDLAAATTFYQNVMDWQVSDSGMEGFTYLLARSGGDMVAGMMSLDDMDDVEGVPPSWLIYFAVDDCDASAATITATGGTIMKGPADIPGTGRFAVAADPQGAVFGLLQPDMSQMSEADRKKAETTGAFDQQKAGHGNWHDLMSTDPQAGFAFYAGLFGWTKGQAMDMGDCPDEAGGANAVYQIFQSDGQDIGGMMGLGQAPVPNWLPYFGSTGIDATIARITEAGGTVQHGPQEVPGGAYIAIATDPQGAWFAVVGPKAAS